MDSRIDVYDRVQFQRHLHKTVVFVTLFFCVVPPVILGQEDVLQRGLNALKESHFDQALEALTIAEKQHPEDPRIHNFRGIALAQLGKSSDAETEYREATRLDPKYQDAWRNLGFLLWTVRRLDQAREALLEGLAISPDDSFSHYYLGRVELDSQRYAEAFRELKLSGLQLPSDPAFLLQTATGHVALGEAEEARKALHQLSTQSLGPAQAAQVASLFVAIRDYTPAIKLLTATSKQGAHDDAAWAYCDLGLAYLLSGNYEQAVQPSRTFVSLQQAKKSAPADIAAAWSLLGIAEARAGQSDAAIHDLREATILEPTDEQHWLNLTREMMEDGRFADSVAATQQGVATNPRSYALHLRLGAAHLAAGQYKQAEAAFRMLADAGDPLPMSYVGLAQLLLREGRAEEAASVLDAASQKIGKSFLLSYFFGLSLDRAGKRHEAAKVFRDAIEQNPQSSEAHFALGKAELALGQVNEAISELQQALRLAPGNVQARRLLSQAYRRIGDTKRSEEFSKDSSDKPPADEGDLLGDFLLPKWQIPEEPHTN